MYFGRRHTRVVSNISSIDNRAYIVHIYALQTQTLGAQAKNFVQNEITFLKAHFILSLLPMLYLTHSHSLLAHMRWGGRLKIEFYLETKYAKEWRVYGLAEVQALLCYYICHHNYRIFVACRSRTLTPTATQTHTQTLTNTVKVLNIVFVCAFPPGDTHAHLDRYFSSVLWPSFNIN